MNKKILITACCLFLLLGTISAQESQLEKAFTAISKLDGFQTYNRQQLIDNGWDADNPRLSKELGNVKMAIHANAEPREQFLAILETIPSSLLYDETIDERYKVTRYYTETDAQGIGYFLFAFVGKGGNDTVAMLYKGGDEDMYKALIH